MTAKEIKQLREQILLEMRKHDKDKEGDYIGNVKTHAYHAGFFDGLDTALKFLNALQYGRPSERGDTDL